MKITVKQLKTLIREALEETATSLADLEKKHQEDPHGQHSAAFPIEDLLKGMSDDKIVELGANLGTEIANVHPNVKDKFIAALRSASDKAKAQSGHTQMGLGESALLKQVIKRAVRSELNKR